MLKDYIYILCNLIVYNLIGGVVKSIYGFRITDTEKIAFILYAIQLYTI